ncbi:hypothetical protein MIR68_002592 [Amoeboaphelidium protococcarum]|nr:hypothetical protein MIR68_002592 [Amoeboaphelidium protococcarum]
MRENFLISNRNTLPDSPHSPCSRSNNEAEDVESLLDIMPSLKLFRVPLLTLLNQCYPEWLSQVKGSFFSHCRRTENADRIDFTAADGRISGECTSTPVLRSRDLITILQRIPQTSIMHLVLVDDLQKLCFSKKVKKEVKLVSFSGFLNEQDIAAEESDRINFDSTVEGQDTIQQLVMNRRLVFLHVSAVDELPVLREIKGLPSVSHNAQTAVIFIKLQLSRE